MDDYDSDDDFNDQYDDDYDYDSDEFIHHHGGYDDLYDDVQGDYGYDVWDPEEELELPSLFSDYHPYWKKSKETFLDLYFVAERTKQLLDSSNAREIIANTSDDFGKIKELETMYRSVDKHLAFSKKRSIDILSKVLSLPSLVIHKIFINIVESYNWHFDQYGPEEMPWLYEELEEDDSESEKDDKYPEFYYNMMSDVHQRVRRCTMFISSDVSYAFFFLKFTLEGIEGIKISDSVSGDG